MRWKKREPTPEPRLGDKKIKRVFFWLPTLVDSEWRWLEFATIECTWSRHVYDSHGNWHGYWREVVVDQGEVESTKAKETE